MSFFGLSLEASPINIIQRRRCGIVRCAASDQPSSSISCYPCDDIDDQYGLIYRYTQYGKAEIYANKNEISYITRFHLYNYDTVGTVNSSEVFHEVSATSELLMTS